MRACWLKWVGRDWSISADYIWLNYSDANIISSKSIKRHCFNQIHSARGARSYLVIEPPQAFYRFVNVVLQFMTG